MKICRCVLFVSMNGCWNAFFRKGSGTHPRGMCAALPHLLGVHQHEEYFLRGLLLHFPQAPMLIQTVAILSVQSDTDDPEHFF